MYDFVSDEDLFSFCNQNQNDSRCLCTNPPDDIKEVFKTYVKPYYCFYEPCFNNQAFVTTELKEKIRQCQTTSCIINIGDINISGGVIEIKNSCLQNVVSNKYKVVYIPEKAFLLFIYPILNCNIIIYLFIIILLFYYLKNGRGNTDYKRQR